MKRAVTPLTLFALMLISSVAWACPVGEEDRSLVALFVAPFLAFPYTLFGAGVIASQARSWFKRPFVGWMLGTLGAWVACTLGAGVGFAISGIDGLVSNVEATIILSTPLVFGVAYLMLLHARRPKR